MRKVVRMFLIVGIALVSLVVGIVEIVTLQVYVIGVYSKDSDFQKVVSGTVVNQEGVFLAGVIVYEDNYPQNCTVTRSNGSYSLGISNNRSKLIFSLIGYKTNKIIYFVT